MNKRTTFFSIVFSKLCVKYIMLCILDLVCFIKLYQYRQTHKEGVVDLSFPSISSLVCGTALFFLGNPVRDNLFGFCSWIFHWKGTNMAASTWIVWSRKFRLHKYTRTFYYQLTKIKITNVLKSMILRKFNRVFFAIVKHHLKPFPN